MSERVINWDKTVLEEERKFRDKMWQRVQKFSAQEKGGEVADMLLDTLSFERERVDPKHPNSFDHEEHWVETGEYPVFKNTDDT